MRLQRLTGSGVRIAVIDSGWDRRRRDARVIRGVGLVDPRDELALRLSRSDHDQHGHGTACAQLALQNAADAQVIPIRVFGTRLETSVTQIDAAIRAAVTFGADVLSMSLATTLEDLVAPLRDATAFAVEHGAIVVAAADRSTGSGYPAAFPHVIGVQAGNIEHRLEFIYDADAVIQCVACGAPPTHGSASRGQRQGRRSSSFAAARMAGILALFREAVPGAGLVHASQWLSAHAIKTVVCAS